MSVSARPIVTAVAIAAAIASLAAAAPARADSPFDVLAKPGATWTYDVYAPRAKRPSGARVTVAVAGVRTVGKYTAIDLTTTDTPDTDRTDFDLAALIIGPDGVRQPFRFDDEGGNTHEGDPYTEAHLDDLYGHGYRPILYLPGKLAKHARKRHVELNLFGEDDRIYTLTGTLTARGAGWRFAWKGTYTIPEEQGGHTRYAAHSDFDPAVGFTEICLEDGTCLRLAPAP